MWYYGMLFSIVIYIFQESSITEAVEKQLQGNSHSNTTPLMGKKTQMSTHSENKTTSSGELDEWH